MFKVNNKDTRTFVNFKQVNADWVRIVYQFLQPLKNYLITDNSVKIHARILQILTTEMFKVKNE